MPLILGCIADDITGGTDLALTLSASGMRVIQTLGDVDPDAAPPEAVDAMVIALKIRTAPIDEAVERALAAADTLRRWGAHQLFFKYCSTFDSTQQGNIGPIADALARHVQADIVPFCPAFPANGRTVFNGHLFVGRQLLSDSPMKDHPLTPMRDADLQAVLSAQSPGRRVGLVPLTAVEAGPDAIGAALGYLRGDGVGFAVVDAVFDRHLIDIGRACAELPLLTGGSAMALGLAGNYQAAGLLEPTPPVGDAPRAAGPIAILSGSCSAASREQVRRAADVVPTIHLKPDQIASGPDALADVIRRACAGAAKGAVVIASTDEPDAVAAAQTRFGRTDISDRVERAHGAIARALYESGVRTFVVAGGETSGAVADALGLTFLRVGPEIAPGVPWMIDAGGHGIRVAFKSGNFGGPDFFLDAVRSARTQDRGA